MLIIKPYGRTATQQKRRILQLKTSPQKPTSLPDFAKTNADILIAQYASIMDKIATKPSGNKKPTREQFEFREKLGQALWNQHVRHLDGDQMQAKWQRRVHPYAAMKDDKGNQKYWQPNNNNKQTPKPTPYGRWYKSFCGETEIDKINGNEIADAIHEHLFKHARSLRTPEKQKNKGLIQLRAESIEQNILKPKDDNQPTWSEADIKTYFASSDIVQEIFQKAAQLKDKPVHIDTAMACLYRHYAAVFKDASGKALSIKDAQTKHPELFALHVAVKDVYRRVFEISKSDYRKQRLPKNKGELSVRLNNIKENSDTNHLIRLGRIIHYQAVASATNGKHYLAQNWPKGDEILQSHYWQSEHQTQIKQTEAFIRIWRSALGLAAYSATQWLNPETSNDILGGNQRKVTVQNYNGERFTNHAKLLFGDHAGDLAVHGKTDLHQNYIALTLLALSNLRNRIFHFKAMVEIETALNEALDTCKTSTDAITLISDYHQNALNEHPEHIKSQLQAIHGDYFYSQDQLQKIFNLITPIAQSQPLPRFKRMLERHKNFWKGKNRRDLPEPGKTDEMKQNPAILCQYSSLKFIYQTGFAQYLTKITSVNLKIFIKKALNITTQEAKKIHSTEEEEIKNLIIAKASTIVNSEGDITIDDLQSQLAAATASEFRIQKGYDSDSEKARESADYIEKFWMDVVILAFDDYLTKNDLGFLRGNWSEKIKLDSSISIVDKLTSSSTPLTSKDWQALLYQLLHFIPVGDVSALLHQIRRYRISLDKSDKDNQKTASDLECVLSIYINLHDYEFGTRALGLKEKLQPFFGDEDDIEKIFPTEGQEHLHLRDLREMARFGALERLQTLVDLPKITSGDIAAFQAITDIENSQKERIELHENNQRNKDISEEIKERYKKLVQDIYCHRTLKSFTHLQDHLRLHRLIMQVLGRYVDYSGLWERDLYFRFLALCHQNNTSPDEVLKQEGQKLEGLKLLQNGQIIEALRRFTANPPPPQDLKNLLPDDSLTKIRNNLAHFNMLRVSSKLNLTQLMNDTRRLVAHDRKLKNAVSKSIKEMLFREGFEISWQTDSNHQLQSARVKSRIIKHLKNVCDESLHGPKFTQMIANAFAGCVEQPQRRAGNNNNRTNAQPRGKKRGRGNTHRSG